MRDVTKSDKLARIRQLNDQLRQHFTGGKVMLTAAVAALDEETKAKVLSAVRTFDQFNEDNDPHHEHDFVAVEVEGRRYFAKTDYYDKTMEYGSEDPSDPAVTSRVLTIMNAGDY